MSYGLVVRARVSTCLLTVSLTLWTTGCFDNGVPLPPPNPLTMAREYSGLWVPDDAEIVKSEDSFYNNGRMYLQGIVELTVQLELDDFATLAREAAARGYIDLASRRTMPADSITYGDAYKFPLGTPGLYLITRGIGQNKILVVLRDDTQTLELEMMQLRNGFFDASASDTVIKRYRCEAGSCSIEPIGWPERP